MSLLRLPPYTLQQSLLHTLPSPQIFKGETMKKVAIIGMGNMATAMLKGMITIFKKEEIIFLLHAFKYKICSEYYPY